MRHNTKSLLHQTQPQNHLYLALAFPRLPTDRLKISPPPKMQSAAHQVLATIAPSNEGMQIVEVTAEADQIGIHKGQTLKHANTLHAEIITAPQDKKADDIYLLHLAHNSHRFTPFVSLSLPYGLMLNITGYDGFFGGPKPMLERVQQYFGNLGLETLAAIAPTSASARAFARFGVNFFVDKKGLTQQLDQLYLSALETLPAIQNGLRNAHFHTLGDIRQIAPKALAARFGNTLPARIAALYGKKNRILSPIAPLPFLIKRKHLAKPSNDKAIIDNEVLKLAQSAFTDLVALNLRCFSLKVELFRIDGHIDTLILEMDQSSNDIFNFKHFLQENLDRIIIDFHDDYSFDTLLVSAQNHIFLQGSQEEMTERSAFWATPQQPNIYHYHIHATKLKLQGFVPLQSNPSERPLKLFCPPQPITVATCLQDGSLISFSRHHFDHKIRSCEGPKHINIEWLKKPNSDRYYYNIEDEYGQRFWIFYYSKHPNKKWFIHGIFA